MTKSGEQEALVEKLLQGGNVRSALVVGGKKRVLYPKRLLFPCISEKGTNFMMERSYNSGT